MSSIEDVKKEAKELLLNPDKIFSDKMLEFEVLVRKVPENQWREFTGELFCELLDRKYGDVSIEAIRVIYETIHTRLLPIATAPNN